MLHLAFAATSPQSALAGHGCLFAPSDKARWRVAAIARQSAAEGGIAPTLANPPVAAILACKCRGSIAAEPGSYLSGERMR